jgi:hypothetical protein
MSWEAPMVSLPEIIQDPSFVAAIRDANPSELTLWRQAFITGLAAGLLSRPSDTQIDLSVPQNVAWFELRSDARQRIEDFQERSPGMSSLQLVQRGIGIVVSRFENALSQYPGLSNELEIARNTKQMVHDQPAYTEGVARFTLKKALLLPETA